MRQTVTYDKTGDDGRFEPTFSPEEFLDAVRDLELPTTGEIADSVECAHRTALHHLNNLEERGDLDSRMVGRAKVWSISDTVKSASDRRESDPPSNPTDSAPNAESFGADEYADMNADAVTFVRNADERVSATAIREHIASEYELGISADSWWRRHGRDAVENAGGEFVRNKGWGIDE